MENKNIEIAESQIEATSSAIASALTTLSEQITASREAGDASAKEIVTKFGGENKMTELIGTLAGYMGQVASVGTTAATTPVIVMAGAAKGVYTKVTESK